MCLYIRSRIISTVPFRDGLKRLLKLPFSRSSSVYRYATKSYLRIICIVTELQFVVDILSDRNQIISTLFHQYSRIYMESNQSITTLGFQYRFSLKHYLPLDHRLSFSCLRNPPRSCSLKNNAFRVPDRVKTKICS